MADHNRFDIIIAGAGAAGLSLLWRLMESSVLQGLNVLLIDQSFEPEHDKTWCYWEDLELPESNLVHHTWNKLLVRINGSTYSESLERYQYHCLRSIDFESSILKKAKQNSQITFLNASILDFSGEKEKGVVQTSNGNFSAKYIFQSVKKPRDFDNLKVDISIIQHFLGWEIETEHDLFDTQTATFMDFDVSQKNGVTFMYLLPFSKNRALIEYTVFSRSILDREMYEEEIRIYLKKRFRLSENQYSIQREEFGAIPMEDRDYPAWYCKHVLNIGRVAGLSKPSTGYTFSRIQRYSKNIVQALENGSELPGKSASGYRFRVYDLMMLYILDCETEYSLTVFNNLFKKNSFDRVLQFLAEETHFLQELAIFFGMPYSPFFRSIYRMKHRILTGA